MLLMKVISGMIRRPAARYGRLGHRPTQGRQRLCRLRLEVLEDRLPPGDILLGAALGSSWLGLSFWADSDSRALAIADPGALSSTCSETPADRLSTPDASRLVALPAALLPGQRSQSMSQGENTSGLTSQASAEPPAADLLGGDGLQALALFADPVQDLGGLRKGRPPFTRAAEDTSLAVAGGGFGSLIAAMQVFANGSGTAQPLAMAANTIVNADPMNYIGTPSPVSRSSHEARQITTDPESSTPLDTKSGKVHALFNLDTPQGGPFPSDRFSAKDQTQNTNRRVNLPLPDPVTHPSDYQDTQVLNTLDGFSLQPRLSVPFDGSIDVNTVSSQTVLLVGLGDTLQPREHRGEVVGINQVVWDVAMTTLHAESDELLAQHTRYALIVTDGIHDAQGNPVEATREFRHFRQTVQGEYKDELLDAIQAARRLGVRERYIVTASVFTTQSATAILEKIRDQIHATTPAPADFNLGPNNERTVLPLDEVAGITWNQQTRDNPPVFNPVGLNLSLLQIYPGSVAQIAFGKYLSPDYRAPDLFFPTVSTRTGVPEVQAVNEIYFNLYLPVGNMPAAGWPVAIFGHGISNDKNTTSLTVASSLAAQGVATIAVNYLGHGFGPLGTLTVNQTGGDTMTFPAGGRGQPDNNGMISSNAGSGGDATRQMAADLMQLVREIEVGMDVDGDGTPDLDPSRIYYFGNSAGGIYGTPLVAVEPDVHAAVLSSTGGVAHLTPSTRNGASLANRVPPLINSPGIVAIEGVPVPAPYYNENSPLRNGAVLTVQLADGTSQAIRSPVVNTVTGADGIQEVRANQEWIAQARGNPDVYAPHLRKEPLPGVSAKSVIIMYGKGDQTVPNPVETAVVRAGDLSDRTTFFRNDLAFAEDPTVPRNPHAILAAIDYPNPLVMKVARGEQQQIATFFASNGTAIIHPEPARFFEVPIQRPLPEELNFIP